MSRITSSIGLVTGIPIADTVEQLVAIKARPRDLLASRTNAIRSEQVAVTELAALLLAVQFTAKNLLNDSVYDARQVVSSNASLLRATVAGNPAVGSHQFTPLQKTQTHQLVSSGIASNDQPLGAGELSFRFGGFVDEGLSLDLLNGGAGVERGKIRITDRSGASAEVDLRFVRTTDDVLRAINNTSEINVTALTVGDRFRLVDETGLAIANLRVQEVAGGDTAQSLGLAGIDVAGTQADGADVLRSFQDIDVEQLNDGNGVGFDDVLPDLEITFRDGTTIAIDLRPMDNTTLRATATTTAANGFDAEVTFTAIDPGVDLSDVAVLFQDDINVVAGGETVVYDAVAKTLTFNIDAGATTANHIAAALNGDPVAGAVFGASLPTGGAGTGFVDVADAATTSLPEASQEKTLGNILASLNAAAPHKLKASLSADGDRIELTDLTADLGGTFAVNSSNDSTAAEDLGLNVAAVGGTLSGGRLLSGLATTLLKSVNGGAGLQLGDLALTDRSGATSTIDLSTAETLDDVIEAINAAPVAIRAQVNRARNGIEFVDTSGASASNLIVANADATNTADLLQLAVNDAVTEVNSGNLHKQVVSRNTLLSSLNGGAGVFRGSIRVIDSGGVGATVRLDDDSIQTIGDVIDEINRVVPRAAARLNETGDGILLIDTLGESGTLSVIEVSGGQTAADLHILGTAEDKVINGQTESVIDGSTTFTVMLDGTQTLQDLVASINALGASVTASSFDDGSSINPYRLTLTSNQAGKAGELLVDTSKIGFNFTESVRAQDTLLLFGAPDDAAVGVIASSRSNTFTDLIPGLSLTIAAGQSEPVTIQVSQSDTNLVVGVESLVANYNRLREKLSEATAFNEETGAKGILLGDASALRIDTDLNRLLSGRFFGVGSIQSLETVGISLNDDGTLTFDATKLRDKFSSDPDSVREFFSKEKLGFAAKLTDLTEQLAGTNSLLSTRRDTLEAKFNANVERINFLTERLERFREQTFNQFVRLELAIGKLQNNLIALNALQVLPPLISRSR